ncbi:MAG: hypothetical protein ACQETH_10895 [Candidatus Rifleibacteriota bacterium]
MKSKKTAIKNKKNQIANPTLSRVGFIFLLCLLPVMLNACDMSAFVQSDFSARCQLLIDLCEKAALSARLDHPDKKEIANELSSEWIRFFLAHGDHSTVPPTLNFIATQTWNMEIKKVGHEIARLIRNKADNNLERLKYKLSLLKNPETIKKMQTVLEQREKHNSVPQEFNRLNAFLNKSLLQPAHEISTALKPDSLLVTRLENSVNFHLQSFSRIAKLKEDGYDQSTITSLLKNLSQEIDNDFTFWETLFFYKTR